MIIPYVLQTTNYQFITVKCGLFDYWSGVGNEGLHQMTVSPLLLVR